MEKFRRDVEGAKTLFRQVDERHPQGRSYALEARHYHGAFDAAFAGAVGEERGRAVAERAREILLDEVLLPYERLIGWFKKPDTLRGYAEGGRLAFARARQLELIKSLHEARDHVLWIHDYAGASRGRPTR